MATAVGVPVGDTSSRRTIGVAMSRPGPGMSRDIEQVSRLLDVTNESELDAFLRRLIDDAARASGRPLSTGSARTVLELAKRTAEQTMPTLATARGADMGPIPQGRESPVATAARVFGLELEGLSAEDRDFEIGGQLVRFVQSAAIRAANRTPAFPLTHTVRAQIDDTHQQFAATPPDIIKNNSHFRRTIGHRHPDRSPR